MTVVGIRHRAPGLLSVALLAVAFGACVPEPANRLTPSPTAAEPTPTPVPTPAGPTPTPSFVRPTPTPQPTFLTYVVRTGDTLNSIAKKHGTTGRSIAYWNRVAYPSLDPDSDAYKPDYLAIGWILVLIPNAQVDPENLPSLPPEPGDSEAPSAEPAAD
jgi:hypothetical protein